MFCIDPNLPTPNYSEKAKDILVPLRVIMVIQIVIGIFYIFFAPFTGLFLLIGVLLLWCSIKAADFCKALIYNLFCLSSLVQLVLFASEWIYTGEYKEEMSFQRIFAYISLASIPVYIAAIYYSFEAYREFKAMMYEGMGGQSSTAFGFSQYQQSNYGTYSQNNSSANRQDRMSEAQQVQAQGQSSRGYTPFGGQGYKL